MTQYVKIIVIVGMVLLAINLIFVPYKSRYEGFLGYGFISSPIKYSTYDGKTYDRTKDSSIMKDGQIDFKRIGLQSGAIIIITLALFLALNRNKS